MPLYMSPNFAHAIGRITGYLRFVPKVMIVWVLHINFDAAEARDLRQTRLAGDIHTVEHLGYT